MKENLAHSTDPHDAVQSISHHGASAMEIACAVAQTCDDAKGKDIAVLNMKSVSDLADYFIVVSGRSDRQVQGLANRVLETLDLMGAEPINVEGLDQGHWVIIDCCDVVVHIFFEPIREHYDIEHLWIKAPRVTLRQDKRGQVTEKKCSKKLPQ